MGIRWEDRWEQLGHLPEHTLYDLVRNQSAPTAFRTTAAEIMVMKGMAKANDPEVQRFLPTTPAPVIHESEVVAPRPVELGTHSVEVARSMGLSVPEDVESVTIALSPREQYTGPLKASVTTSSLLQPEIVPEKPAAPVQTTSVDEKK